MDSIEGMQDHEHAHLSTRMRQKLQDERSAGKKTLELAGQQQEYNQRLQRDIVEQDARRATLEAEALAKARAQARQETAENAAAQQEINAQVNLDKEIRDQQDNMHGRGHVPAHPAVAAMAQDIVRQRTEQAKAGGFVPAGGVMGSPEGSEAQAAAAQANAEKEVADRAGANNYEAAGTYQGHSGEVAAGNTDEWGNPIGEPQEGQAPAEPYGGVDDTEAGDGQPEHVDEPTAADMLAGVGEPAPRRRRGRPPVDRRAVGDGPKSE